MLVKFQTKFQATITMFGVVAVTHIKLMGHSGIVPSALLAEDMPVALARLKAAVAERSNKPQDPQAGSSRDGEEAQSVSLAHRAVPLIEMLTAAVAEHENVMRDD